MKSYRFYYSLLIVSALFFINPPSFLAQSLLVNPTAEGGFELAGGFSGNGWTTVNSSVNTWNTGSASVPFAGSNAAYISSNNGTNYDYDPTTLQTSHFYRDVTVPLNNGSIQLSFRYKSVGEQFFDRLLVFVAPTSVTPLVNDPASNAVPNNQIAGATLVFTDQSTVGSYVQKTIFLPPSLAGTTFRLIFTWQNDNSSAPVAPASIDNISVFSQPLSPLNGVYTINNTLPTSSGLPASGSNFNSFSDAIGYMNVNGIAGPVTFNVSAGQTFNEAPQTIQTTGTSQNSIIFQKSGTGNNPIFLAQFGIGGADAAFALNGADYITFNGIDVATNVSASFTEQMEYGFYLTNLSGTDGCNHTTIKNCKISLSNANTSSIAFFQTISSAPSILAGTNYANKLIQVEITNSALGVYFNGSTSAGLQDDSCQVVNSTIGGVSAFDIGGGFNASQTAGIWMANQKNCTVTGNTVRNIGNPALVHGIFIDRAYTFAEVSGNKIYNVANSGSASTAVASGISARVPTTGNGHTIRIYNNFISSIRSSYSGAGIATRVIRGMNLQSGGSSNTTCLFEVSHNSVSIDGSSSPNCSSTCFETGAASGTGPALRLRNNIFVNFTGPQSATSKHYCLRMPSATVFGSTALNSASNNNDFYIADFSNGFVGNGNLTDYQTLNNWQTAYNQDANSISVDPIFTSINDLHANNSALNSAAAVNTFLPYITTDIDAEIRAVPNGDIGADEFTVYTFDIKPTALLQPVNSGCFTSSQAVSVRVQNFTANSIDFSSTPLTVVVNVSGVSNQTISYTISDNSLNANVPLAGFSFLTVPVGNINMSAYGSYTLRAITSCVFDQNANNDSLSAVTITNAAPFSLPQQVDFSSYSGINLTTLFTGWHEATGSTPAGSVSNWESWTDFGFTGNINARVTLDGNTKREWMIGPKVLPATNTVLSYKAAVTAVASASNAPSSLGADDKLYIMISTDCGISYQKIDSLTATSGLSNSLNQYFYPLYSYAGQEVILAFMASEGNLQDGNCDLHLDDINIESLTSYDLSVTTLSSPFFEYCYSNAESIIVELKNTGPIPIDFSTENVILNATVTGPLNSTYSLPISSGVLFPGASQSYTVTTSLDLSQAGAYTIRSYASLTTTDVNNSNDTLTSIVFSQNPSLHFSPSVVSVCRGDSIQLSPAVQINGFTSLSTPSFVNNHNPLPIPDADTTGITSTIAVSGVGGFAAQLISVKVDSLLHTFTGDLVLTLVAPDGSSMILSANNGGSGDNYIQTNFSSTSSNSILAASNPFTGTYSPQQSFNLLTGNANGNWRLKVKDVSTGDVGSLIKWSINFQAANTLQSFTWTNTSTLNSSDSIHPVAFPQNNEVYQLTITDANACTSTDSIIVNVNALPVVSISLPSDSLCSNATAVQTQFSPSGGQFTGQGIDASGIFNPSLVSSGIQQLIYTYTDTTNCTNSDSITVFISQAPQVGLEFTTDFACINDPVLVLSGESPSGGIFSGTGITSGANFDPSVAGVGTFFVTYTYTDNNSCVASASDTVVVSSCVGVNELSQSEIRVFPTPAREYFSVTGLLNARLLELADLQGKILLRINTPSETEIIDMNNLSESIYFLKVYFPNSETKVFRIAKSY